MNGHLFLLVSVTVDVVPSINTTICFCHVCYSWGHTAHIHTHTHTARAFPSSQILKKCNNACSDLWWFINHSTQSNHRREFYTFTVKVSFFSDCTFMFCLLGAAERKIEVTSHQPAAASPLLRLFLLSNLSLIDFSLHLLFPLTCFDTASLYSFLASVQSFKRRCQAKGMFCFSFFSKTTQLDMARGSYMVAPLPLRAVLLLCCCLMKCFSGSRDVWFMLTLLNQSGSMFVCLPEKWKATHYYYDKYVFVRRPHSLLIITGLHFWFNIIEDSMEWKYSPKNINETIMRTLNPQLLQQSNKRCGCTASVIRRKIQVSLSAMIRHSFKTGLHRAPQ